MIKLIFSHWLVGMLSFCPHLYLQFAQIPKNLAMLASELFMSIYIIDSVYQGVELVEGSVSPYLQGHRTMRFATKR